MTNLFDHPFIFNVSQKMVPFTVWVYKDLMKAHIPSGAGRHVLDIGCGVGAHANFFVGQYTGIDVNRRYIDVARGSHSGSFQVMDGAALAFPNATFDMALTVATFHHMSDQQVRAAVGEAIRVLRPGGTFHVIDPVLPFEEEARFKKWLFLHDRGRHQRTIGQLEEVLSSSQPIKQRDFRSGLLHDVAYFGFIKEQ